MAISQIQAFRKKWRGRCVAIRYRYKIYVSLCEGAADANIANAFIRRPGPRETSENNGLRIAVRGNHRKCGLCSQKSSENLYTWEKRRYGELNAGVLFYEWQDGLTRARKRRLNLAWSRDIDIMRARVSCNSRMLLLLRRFSFSFWYKQIVFQRESEIENPTDI